MGLAINTSVFTKDRNVLSRVRVSWWQAVGGNWGAPAWPEIEAVEGCVTPLLTREKGAPKFLIALS